MISDLNMFDRFCENHPNNVMISEQPIFTAWFPQMVWLD